jgi:hypothetical protein
LWIFKVCIDTLEKKHWYFSIKFFIQILSFWSQFRYFRFKLILYFLFLY